MSMDILCLDAAVRELSELLPGAAVSQIHQPGAADLVFRLWTGRENLRLLISVAPRAGRIHLTDRKQPNPQAPPRFCQLLRARLNRLLAIERLPGERIVRLLFSGEQSRRWTLVVELVGSNANLLLLDEEDRIVDALKRFEESTRPALPGQIYAPPPRLPRIDLLTEIPLVPADEDFADWLLQTVTPMTPLMAENLASAVACGNSPQAVLEDFRERCQAGRFEPCIVHRQGGQQLSALVPEYLEMENLQRFPSMSLAADSFYREASGEAVFGGGRNELERTVQKVVKRLKKRLAHIDAEADRTQDFERQKQLGDLLLGNLFRLRRGMATVTVDDWFADPPEPVTITLDPALTPQENAEAYFRRHRKGKRGQEHIARRRAETQEEMDWLAGVALALEETETPQELVALRQELVDGGVLKEPQRPVRRAPSANAPVGVRQTFSPSGLKIFWGRNNTSNDQVSKQLTGADDLWFHTHNCPGCHLVLKREGKRDIPEEDIRYAAALAAGYSQARNDHKVEVMMAEGRSVRKPKGARPGLVLAEPVRTLMVAPLRLDEHEPEKI